MTKGLTDLEIARKAQLKPIPEVADFAGIEEEYLELYGKYKAKVSLRVFEELKTKKPGKLVLITAMTPTPMGEGKTTVSIGLSQAFNQIGKKSIVALREPSLGPVFGIKGGATGGGRSQVLPMEEINLHFTGDFHAIDSSHNLLSAMIDNHIHQSNRLGIDLRRIVWPRAMDMNDRALRKIVVSLGGVSNGFPREDGYVITPASEIMAILGLSKDYRDLKERLGNILIGYTRERNPIFARDLGAHGAMAALLVDALKPNLVQTIENTPALVHTGPFGNIAHGTCSILAIKLAHLLSDVAVVEAGFGADLGAEKFLNIVCPLMGVHPDAVVIVASLRALKFHGGVPKDRINEKNNEALLKGLPNLFKHVENIGKFGLPSIVAINPFPTDDEEEVDLLKSSLEDQGIPVEVVEVWEKGGEGGIPLAERILKAFQEKKPNFRTIYQRNMPLKEKIELIAREIYGADGVEYMGKTASQLRRIEKLGFSDFFVCMAKTQYSLSDDPKLLGRPEGFKIRIREIRVKAGAGFIVPLSGDIMEMPGLPKKPAALEIDIDDEGNISGIF
jgi:formate--tetrahydrofolate ligase